MAPSCIPPPDNESFVRHPPERGRRTQESIVVYSCCCCCCCCLHTVGGAIGALLAGSYSGPVDKSQQPPARLPSAQSLYWSSFAIALLLGGATYAAPIAFGDAFQSGMAFVPSFLGNVALVGLSVILVGPLWLLAACGVMALQIAIRPKLRRLPAYWKQLGWITLSIVVGTIVGIAAMAILAVFGSLVL